MDVAATIFAALIGAVVGSLGAEWFRARNERRVSEEQRRRDVAQTHMVQLQDALESLWFRLDNLAAQYGRSVMASDYYENSTLYVLASFLAQKRRLVLDGAYAALDVFGGGFPAQLDAHLESIEASIGDEGGTDISFYRYERRALSDSILQWDAGWRILTYGEFLRVRADPAFDDAFVGAVRFIEQAHDGQLARVRDHTAAALRLVATKTGFATPVPM